jgi:hypothetical protein
LGELLTGPLPIFTKKPIRCKHKLEALRRISITFCFSIIYNHCSFFSHDGCRQRGDVWSHPLPSRGGCPERRLPNGTRGAVRHASPDTSVRPRLVSGETVPPRTAAGGFPRAPAARAPTTGEPTEWVRRPCGVVGVSGEGAFLVDAMTLDRPNPVSNNDPLKARSAAERRSFQGRPFPEGRRMDPLSLTESVTCQPYSHSPHWS